MSAATDQLLARLRAEQPQADIEQVAQDDLGDHFVMWIEKTEKDGGPAGIWFYVDEINTRIVVEHIGARPK